MLACVSCHFNPAGYRRPEENFCGFATRVTRQGVALYTAELAFGDAPHRLPPVGRVFRLRSQSVLWQKERLLNWLVGGLPPEVDKVCVADADVLFDDPDWAAKTEDALDRFNVLQPFSRAVFLPPHLSDCARDDSLMAKPSAFADRLAGGAGDPFSCAMGLAWAFRRDFLEKIGGLYDRGVLGGGDTFLNWAVWGGGARRYGPAMDADLNAYLARVRGLSPRAGVVEGTAFHLFHGSSHGRRYEDRYEIAVRHGYDPAVDVRREGAVWEWATDKPEFHREVAEYFAGRREDE